MSNWMIWALRGLLVLLGTVNAAGAYYWFSLELHRAALHGLIATLVLAVLILWRPTPVQRRPAFPEHMADVYRRAR
jgi:membrane protein YdbS with pleckstrin-like domain